MKISLRASLAALWVLVAVVSAVLAVMLLGLFRLGVGAQVEETEKKLDRARRRVAERFAVYAASFPAPPSRFDAPERRRELQLLLELALADFPRVEGGFWDLEAGSLAYAYPTYGGGVKTDLPTAELARITDVVRTAAVNGRPERRRFDRPGESTLYSAEALAEGPPALAVWLLSRAHVEGAAASSRLLWGLGAAALLTLLSGAGMLVLLRAWSRRISSLEQAIAATPSDAPPPLAETGQGELDRIVGAVNGLHARLRDSQAETRRLHAQLVQSERLAVVGRMAAQLAHEIRNPLAGMRLRTENALARPERQGAALEAMLPDIGRLDDLLDRLLAMARLNALHPREVALGPWLESRLELARAAAPNAIVSGSASVDTWTFDPDALARALDNLLLNAAAHVPPGGRITVSAERTDSSLCLAVENDGDPVPDERRETIFEPFVSARPGGSGLGLPIARGIAESHGGTLECVPRERGARFEILLPCPAS